MKTTIIFQAAHTHTTGRQQASGKTESLLDQVRKLTLELQSIKSHLHRELAEEDGILSKLPNSGTSSDIQALKSAADEIRQLLWFCLQNESHNDSPTVPKRGRHSQQYASQVEPLLVSEATPPLTRIEAGSFFERLHLVIDGYMQNRGIACGEKRRKY